MSKMPSEILKIKRNTYTGARRSEKEATGEISLGLTHEARHRPVHFNLYRF